MSARSIRRSSERREARLRRRVRQAAIVTGTAVGAGAFAAPAADAANFPVTNLNNAGAGSLRAAIISANGSAGPDSITFTGAGAAGEIRLTTGDIAITDDLTITGPGAGTLAVSGDADNDNVRDFATSAVALGDSRIFNIDDPSAPGAPVQRVSISGLTLREGVSDDFAGTLQERDGGAIYSRATALELTNMVFTDNVSTGDGGAIYQTEFSNAGRLSAVNSLFTQNRTRDSGGAIYSEPQKYAPGDPAAAAGTTIAGSQVTNNRAGGNDFGGLPTTSPSGGGLTAKYEMSISDTTITGNTATGGDGAGGGAYLQGYGTVSNTTVRGNSAEDGGGLWMGQVRLRSSTVSGNTATSVGGGIFTLPVGSKYEQSPIRIDNSTVSGNSVTGAGPYEGYGGGVSTFGLGEEESLVVRNSTIASNTASKKGGGLFTITQGDTAPAEPFTRLRSSIVADNVAGGAPNDLGGLNTGAAPPPADDPGTFIADFSLVEAPGSSGLVGDPAGSNLVGVDPELGPLGDNGGPTQTHSLGLTSPAIDAALAGPFTTDQRGQPRTVDAAATNLPLSDGTDMGSLELQDASAPGGDPDTSFTKKPKKKLKLKADKSTAKLKVKFSGTDNVPPAGPLTFECKVDKAPFDECKSPLKLELSKGKHTIEVRAIDSEGRVDATPAEAKVKVKKSKPKGKK